MAQFKADAHRVSAVSLAELYALQSFIFAFQVEHTKTGDMLEEKQLMQTWDISLLRAFELNKIIYYYKLPVASTLVRVQ